jgi:hypothetical protein
MASLPKTELTSIGRDAVAPTSRSGSKPFRALVALAAIIVIMSISVLGKETFHPGEWHQQFKVALGLDPMPLSLL